MPAGTILRESKNCWRIKHAERSAFLIDGAAYFESLASALDQAKRSIYIAGWDIDSRINLVRGKNHPYASVRLGEFLNNKVSRTPQLQAYVLIWDFAMIFALEREWLPLFRLGWKTHPRVRFHMDGEHPIGGCQHQKIVVVDDSVAFCGGLDLTKVRWDTPEHRSWNPLRKDPSGNPYAPFHDVQMVVDGEAAAALGDLFRDRWLWATGEMLSRPGTDGPAPWPKGLTPDLRDIRVGIARTLPAYKDREEVREVEALYLDSIRAAKNHIYMENQYLTSAVIADALGESLHKENGPEIILVVPRETGGWLEQSTMDALRVRIVKRLLQADRHGRLRVLYPALEEDGQSLFVHAKVMVVDDRLARVGSSNLSNRSMGLDSECDLAVEAEGDSREAEGINALLGKLVAEHLGTKPETISQALSEHKSLIKVIDSLSDSMRALRRLDIDQKMPVDGPALVPDSTLLDPERPAKLDKMLDQFITEENGSSKKAVKVSIVLMSLLGLAAAWRWTPLSEWTDMEKLTAFAHLIKESPLSLLFVCGAYVLGGMVMFPITVLIGATAVVFSPVMGSVYALLGCLSSSIVTYLFGAKLGKETIRKFAGRRLNRVSKRLAKRGILTMAVVRNLPVAPFTVVNMLAGASHVKFRDYLIGTALGMIPGIVAITLLADRLVELVKEPSLRNVLIGVGIAVVLIVLSWWTKRRLSAGPRE